MKRSLTDRIGFTIAWIFMLFVMLILVLAGIRLVIWLWP